MYGFDDSLSKAQHDEIVEIMITEEIQDWWRETDPRPAPSGRTSVDTSNTFTPKLFLQDETCSQIQSACKTLYFYTTRIFKTTSGRRQPELEYILETFREKKEILETHVTYTCGCNKEAWSSFRRRDLVADTNRAIALVEQALTELPDDSDTKSVSTSHYPSGPRANWSAPSRPVRGSVVSQSARAPRESWRRSEPVDVDAHVHDERCSEMLAEYTWLDDLLETIDAQLCDGLNAVQAKQYLGAIAHCRSVIDRCRPTACRQPRGGGVASSEWMDKVDSDCEKLVKELTEVR